MHEKQLIRSSLYLTLHHAPLIIWSFELYGILHSSHLWDTHPPDSTMSKQRAKELDEIHHLVLVVLRLFSQACGIRF